MAIQLPVGGEEFIEMDFSGDKALISGSFYKRLLYGLKSKSHRSLLKVFLRKWTQVLSTVSANELPAGENWELKNDHFLVKVPLGKKGEFLIDAYSYDEFYRRVILSLSTKINSTPPVKIHLFPSECF